MVVSRYVRGAQMTGLIISDKVNRSTMPGFREFLRSSNGRYVGYALVVLGVAAAGYSIYANLHDENAAVANSPTFVCAETGKSFAHTLQIGETLPIMSPYSGKKTGYLAELCFWTKDGKIKKDPTPVLLNHFRNQPEPTFCPDCGRLVVGHNPPPFPNSTPPPTRAEYEAKR